MDQTPSSFSSITPLSNSLGMMECPIILIIWFILFSNSSNSVSFCFKHFLMDCNSLSSVYPMSQSWMLQDYKYPYNSSQEHSYRQFSKLFMNSSVSISLGLGSLCMLATPSPVMKVFPGSSLSSDLIYFREQVLFSSLICLALSLISSILPTGFLFSAFRLKCWLLPEGQGLTFFSNFSCRFYLRRRPSQSLSFSKRIFQRLEAVVLGWEDGRVIEDFDVSVEGLELIEGSFTGTKTVLSFFILIQQQKYQQIGCHSIPQELIRKLMRYQQDKIQLSCFELMLL